MPRKAAAKNQKKSKAPARRPRAAVPPPVAAAAPPPIVVPPAPGPGRGGAREGSGRKSFEALWLRGLDDVDENGIPWAFIAEAAAAGVEQRDIIETIGLSDEIAQAHADRIAKVVRQGHAKHRLLIGRRIQYEAVRKGRASALLTVVKQWLEYGKAVDEATDRFFLALEGAQERLVRELDRLNAQQRAHREDAEQLRGLGLPDAPKGGSKPRRERS